MRYKLSSTLSHVSPSLCQWYWHFLKFSVFLKRFHILTNYFNIFLISLPLRIFIFHCFNINDFIGQPKMAIGHVIALVAVVLPAAEASFSPIYLSHSLKNNLRDQWLLHFFFIIIQYFIISDTFNWEKCLFSSVINLRLLSLTFASYDAIAIFIVHCCISDTHVKFKTWL